VISCSKQVLLQESTKAEPPQYLETIRTETNEDNIEEKLLELQKYTPEEFRIGLGDRFHFSIYGEEDFDLDDVIVKPDGTISLKLIGETQVSGFTLKDAITSIEERYSKYLISPRVSLIPYQLSSSQVTINGKVERPGIYDIKGTMRVLDAIAVSGGLSTGLQLGSSVELADLAGSFVVRDNTILPVDFVELMRKGNMLHNIPLKNGDYIFISSAVNREIYILGEVVRAGHFPYREDFTLMQSLSFAWGVKDSAYKEAIIIRGGLTHPRVFHVNMKKIVSGESQDFPLESNDIVFIPKSKMAEWNHIVNLILPSLQTLQSGWLIKTIIDDVGK
jgi:polysaccharide export outer membrane protein